MFARRRRGADPALPVVDRRLGEAARPAQRRAPPRTSMTSATVKVVASRPAVMSVITAPGTPTSDMNTPARSAMTTAAAIFQSSPMMKSYRTGRRLRSSSHHLVPAPGAARLAAPQPRQRSHQDPASSSHPASMPSRAAGRRRASSGSATSRRGPTPRRPRTCRMSPAAGRRRTSRVLVDRSTAAGAGDRSHGGHDQPRPLSAETAATGMLPAFRPKVITMKTTSTPSRKTPLNDTTKPNSPAQLLGRTASARAASAWSR